MTTQRKQGDSWVSDSDQYAYPHNCTLEAMRTQGRCLLFRGVAQYFRTTPPMVDQYPAICLKTEFNISPLRKDS
jgi:hypothetical protein